MIPAVAAVIHTFLHCFSVLLVPVEMMTTPTAQFS